MMKEDFLSYTFCFPSSWCTFNALSFVVIADVSATIITVDIDFLAIVIDANDTGVAATAISADCVSLVFVIDVIVLDVAVVFAYRCYC